MPHTPNVHGSDPYDIVVMGRARSEMKLLPYVRQDQRARIAIPIVHGIDVLLAEKPVTARITLDASSDRQKVDARGFWRVSP